MKFEITITENANTVNNKDAEYYYTIEDSYGHRNPPKKITIPPLKQGQKLVKTTDDIQLYYSGDSFLTIDNKPKLNPQTIYIFHTTSRNTVFFSALALFIAIGIAILTAYFG